MPLYAEPRLLPAGDLAVSVELADEISREANARVLTLERLLTERPIPGIVDTVPTFRSLLVHYDPLRLPWEALASRIRALAAELAGVTPPAGRRVELPCAYGGEQGPDLEEVARRLALAPDEVVRPARGRRLLRLLHRLHPRAALHDRDARAPDHPPARPPADQDPARQRRDRRDPVLDLLGGEPRRLLGARTHAAPALRPRPRPTRSCSAPATTFGSGRSTPPSTPRSRRPWPAAVIDPASRRPILGERSRRRRSRPPDHRPGPRAPGLPAARHPAVGPARPPGVRARQPAGRQSGRRRRARADLEGAAAVVTLKLGPARSGVRAYLAIAGGIETPPALGSRSTYARCRLGGLEGRALRKADRLPLGPMGAARPHRLHPDRVPTHGASLTWRWCWDPRTTASPRAASRPSTRPTRCCPRAIGWARGSDAPSSSTPADDIISSDGVALGGIQVIGDVTDALRPIGIDGGYTKIGTICSFHIRLDRQAEAGGFRRVRRGTRCCGRASGRWTQPSNRNPDPGGTPPRPRARIMHYQVSTCPAPASPSRRRSGCAGWQQPHHHLLRPVPVLHHAGRGPGSDRGTRRLDFNGNYTSLILGHANPQVVKAIQDAVVNGMSGPERARDPHHPLPGAWR